MLAFAAFLGWLLYGQAQGGETGIYRNFLLVLICGFGLLLIPWRWMFVSVLAMLMVVQGGIQTIDSSLADRRTRSYFGVYTVIDYPSRGVRMLSHGTTLHGQQSTDPASSHQPLTYYGPGSGIAIAMEQAPQMFGDRARIGVVGLGTGTLACFRKPGQRFTFFEIDPAVLQLSRNRTFTFLGDCAPDAGIVLGDARLELAKAKPESFDLLVIDAFSSDAIPLHLLTEEALGSICARSPPMDCSSSHISNRFIELEPVLAAIAQRHGLSALERLNNPSDRNLYTPSSWIAFSRSDARLEELAAAYPMRHGRGSCRPQRSHGPTTTPRSCPTCAGATC